MFGEPKMAGNVWFFLISSFGETSVAGRRNAKGGKMPSSHHQLLWWCLCLVQPSNFVWGFTYHLIGGGAPRLAGDLLSICRCKELGEENQAGKTKKQKKDKYMLHSLNLFDTSLVHMNFPSPFFLVSEKLRWRSCKRTLHIWLKEKNTFKAAPTSTGPGTSTMLVMLGISGVDFFGGAPDTWHQ